MDGWVDRQTDEKQMDRRQRDRQTNTYVDGRAWTDAQAGELIDR